MAEPRGNSGQGLPTLFGDPSRFALESELVLRDGGWCFVHFRGWGAGVPFGDYEDHATLGGIANWTRDALRYSGQRHEPDLDGMQKEQVFAAVYDPYFADHGTGQWSGNESRAGAWTRLHLTHIGTSAFSEDVAVMLLETRDGRERLLRRRWADGVAHEVFLDGGEFERVAAEFLAWADAVLAGG